MPDENGTTEGNEQTGQAAEGTEQEQRSGEGKPAEKTYSQAELDSALADARKEAAKWRTEHKKLADSREAAEKAQMSEDERKATEVAKRERELADRETTAQERLVSAALKEAAAAAGVAPAKLALMPRLIDRADVEFDEKTGEPTNAAVLVEALLKQHPDFKAGTPPAGGSADGGARGKTTLTREMIRNMSAAEINARWAEVSEFLSRAGNA